MRQNGNEVNMMEFGGCMKKAVVCSWKEFVFKVTFLHTGSILAVLEKNGNWVD